MIICYSGDLEKTWASLILASTAAASGTPTKMFLTFWGLQTFVKDEVRITGQNWMQKMMSVMQRPGISHRKLSKMNFMGMGPWMMGTLAKQYGVAKPKELLEAAMALGVELMPCQMTMDMFGLKRDRHDRWHGRARRRRHGDRAARQRRGTALHLNHDTNRRSHAMTAVPDAKIAVTRTVDARGSYCPGPLMELIRAIRESAVGDVIAVLSSDKGSKTDIPEVDREGGPPARLARVARRLRRDRGREGQVTAWTAS